MRPREHALCQCGEQHARLRKNGISGRESVLLVPTQVRRHEMTIELKLGDPTLTLAFSA